MQSVNLDRKELADQRAWRETSDQAAVDPRIFLRVKIAKISEIPKFLRSYEGVRDQFAEAKRILEIGGGTCWAATYVKADFPDKYIAGSDICDAPAAARELWEPFFGVSIDQHFLCSSHEIPVPDGSLDVVFAFEAAHHFMRHRATLQELYRVLAPGGAAFYFGEPTTGKALYRFAFQRVNARRYAEDVVEDVIVHAKLLQIASEVGFSASVQFDPHHLNRGPVETLYYMVLARLPWLCGILPCTGSFAFHKPRADHQAAER